MMRIFGKLCALATFDLFKQCCQINILPAFYDDDELELMRDQIESIREDQFLEELYGLRARLEDKEWIIKIA